MPASEPDYWIPGACAGVIGSSLEEARIDTMLATMAILIDSPWLAACLGLALIGLGRWRRRRAAQLAGGLWLLYSVYETGMKLRWLCSGECNIRVDLLLVYPLLLFLTIAAVVAIVRRRPAPPRA